MFLLTHCSACLQQQPLIQRDHGDPPVKRTVFKTLHFRNIMFNKLFNKLFNNAVFEKPCLASLPFRRVGALSVEHVATLQSDTLLFGKSMDLFFQLGLRDQILDLHGRVCEWISVSTWQHFESRQTLT